MIYTANSVLLFRKSAEVCRKIYISTKLKRVLSVACSVGFVSRKTFGKQSKRPCFRQSSSPRRMEFGLGIEIRLYFSKQTFTTSKHTAGILSRRAVLFDFFIKSTCILSAFFGKIKYERRSIKICVEFVFLEDSLIQIK